MERISNVTPSQHLVSLDTLELLDNGTPVLIHRSAGTGKSYVLDTIALHLSQEEVTENGEKHQLFVMFDVFAQLQPFGTENALIVQSLFFAARAVIHQLTHLCGGLTRNFSCVLQSIRLNNLAAENKFTLQLRTIQVFEILR